MTMPIDLTLLDVAAPAFFTLAFFTPAFFGYSRSAAEIRRHAELNAPTKF